MIADEKLRAFVQQAGELWAAGPSGATDPPGALSSDQVFAGLRWSAEDQRYFQEDEDNLLRELEYQGAVVIWDESRRVSGAATPSWMVSTFTLTDKGQAQAGR